jgi:hypothetical protein
MKRFANNLWLVLVGLVILFTACKKEADPVLPAPELRISGDTTGAVRPGAPVAVTLQLNAGGANRSLVVNRNGGFLQEITLDAAATTYTFNSQPVAASAEEGEEIDFEFRLVNSQGTESGPVSYRAVVSAYESVTVGTTSLFRIPVPADGIVPSGETVRLARNRRYFLERTIIFGTGARFLAGAGAEVYLNTSGPDKVSILINNGQAEISGTQQAPVVMTSDKTLRGQTPAPGDWGNFNLTGGGNGTDQGGIRYLRIEYPGDRGLRLQNVGSGTEVSYVQVFFGNGDGVMATDGDVNMSHVVVTNAAGGSFRFGDAHAGRAQFLIGLATTKAAEADELVVRETATTVLANTTFVGPGAEFAQNTHGIRLRGSSQGKVYNTIVAAYPRRAVRAVESVQVTGLTGQTVFAHSFVFNIARNDFADFATAFAGTFDATSGQRLTNPFSNNVTAFTAAAGYTTTPIAGIGINDYVPDAETASPFNPTTLDAFFQAAPFVGAVRNTAEDWTRGWTRNVNNTIRQ